MENGAQAAATMGSRMDPATLAHTPALEPPKGVTPNFVDPYSLQPLTIGIVVLCLVLTAIATGIRVYTRVRTVKGHWEECKWIHHSLYYMIATSYVSPDLAILVWVSFPMMLMTHVVCLAHNRKSSSSSHMVLSSSAWVTLAEIATNGIFRCSR